jgi:transposase
VETHRAVFTWVQECLVAAGLLQGRTVAIDATTLEANAAMRSIVRRDTGERYQDFLTRLAAESGIKTPTREALARLDRRRKKRTSNQDWENPSDPDAKITKMKDGRTHLAHTAEHAVDLDSGALVAVTLHGADVGDTTSLVETAIAAAEHVEAAHAASPTPARLAEIVADKGYHGNQTMIALAAVAVRSYIAEPVHLVLERRPNWRRLAQARERVAPGSLPRHRLHGRHEVLPHRPLDVDDLLADLPSLRLQERAQEHGDDDLAARHQVRAPAHAAVASGLVRDAHHWSRGRGRQGGRPQITRR